MSGQALWAIQLLSETLLRFRVNISFDMCFSVSVNLVREEMEKRFNVLFPKDILFEPGYFFTAFEHPAMPVITSSQSTEIRLSHWGLIPSWVKNREQAEKIRNKTINARAETLFKRPSYRKPASRQHCLIPASGFYEWHDYRGKKYPYYLYLKKEKAFAIAGLYDKWYDHETGEYFHTFTLITVEANPLLARIHNTKKRMPAIMPRYLERQWLQPSSSLQDVRKLLITPDEHFFGYHPVSVDMKNKQANKTDASVIRPYDYGFDPLGDNLF